MKRKSGKLENCISKHSQKKRKVNLEIRLKLAFLRTYVEKRTILEPILLYSVSKCKQTKEEVLVYQCFSFFCRCKYNGMKLLYVVFFSRNTNQHCMKNRAERQTTYIIRFFFIIFCQELPIQQLGDRHSNNTDQQTGWCMYCVTFH